MLNKWWSAKLLKPVTSRALSLGYWARILLKSVNPNDDDDHSSVLEVFDDQFWVSPEWCTILNDDSWVSRLSMRSLHERLTSRIVRRSRGVRFANTCSQQSAFISICALNIRGNNCSQIKIWIGVLFEYILWKFNNELRIQCVLLIFFYLLCESSDAFAANWRFD